MNKKISTIIVMLTMVSSVMVISAQNPLDECPCQTSENLDCSLWSTDDNTVNLGSSSWSLLDGTATVTAYKSISCDYFLYNEKENSNQCNDCLVCGELTHRLTRGLGVSGEEDDEVNSINDMEFIIISFDTAQRFKFFEVRSLFIEPFGEETIVEEGNAVLLLNGDIVHRFQFKAEEKIGETDGSVIVTDLTQSQANLKFDQIAFFVNLSETSSKYSEFAVAKLETYNESISFVDQIKGVDCDNYETEDLVPFVYHFVEGWNIITLPLNMDNNSFGSIFGDLISSDIMIHYFYGWNSEGQMYELYRLNDQLIPGYGYWVYVYEALNYTIYGSEITEDLSVEINPFWNMIGWVHSNTITAEHILASIPECSIVAIPDYSILNEVSSPGEHQDFYIIHHAGEANNNFEITQGIGFWVGVGDYSIWDGNVTDNLPPIANASGPYEGLEGEELVLDGSASFDFDGEIVQWIWSYTNGEIFPESIGEGETIVHTWENTGVYNLTLTVVDDDGAEDIYVTIVSIFEDTDGDGIPDNEDTDDDNDGISDIDEETATDEGYNLDPKDPDTDNDGIPDGQEDEDQDGLNNDIESDENSTTITDIDQDGIADLIDPLDTGGGNNNNGNGGGGGHSSTSDNDDEEEDTETEEEIPDPNTEPTRPVIEGPENATVDEIVEFKIVAEDADGDLIKYLINWGNGEKVATVFFPSGEMQIFNHSWDAPGKYTITVKADDGNLTTNETSFEITIKEKAPEPQKDNDEDEEENIFWAITGILSAFLFAAPIGLIYRRKFHE